MKLGAIRNWLTQRFNLLQPDYKFEIRVNVMNNDDLRVYVPNIRSKGEAKQMCESLIRASQIVAMKANLQLIIGED